MAGKAYISQLLIQYQQTLGFEEKKLKLKIFRILSALLFSTTKICKFKSIVSVNIMDTNFFCQITACQRAEKIQ